MYEQIIKCIDWKNKGSCKNENHKNPLAMHIPKECRVMIVSQAPSKSASNLQVLADYSNSTFKQFLSVLNIDVETFNKYCYWTHYGKCYPGPRKGGDQWPKVHCADKYLKDEISICKENGLSVVIGISEPSSKYLYTRFVDTGSKRSKVKYKNIRNIKYKHDDITWMFIKHTASTAYWSKDDIDRDFITKVLQPEIKKAL